MDKILDTSLFSYYSQYEVIKRKSKGIHKEH